MTPTSIRLPDDLKARLERRARAAGKTFHGYLLELLESATAQVEKRAAFVQSALDSRAQDASKGTYPMDEVHSYYRARARGESPRRPKPGKWRK